MQILFYPYLWNIKPSFLYILFVKVIFHILYFISGSLERVFRIFRFIQFDFLPLSFMRLPIIGIINYDFSDFSKDEKMVMINNIPVFKIGNGSKKILYIHGGGFISGDYMSFRLFCLEIYYRCKKQDKDVEIWFPCYSLYPENNINNMIDELNYIYSLYSDEFSHIIADSAGGYLSLNIKNIKKDIKMILISPVFDLKCCGKDNKDDINFNPFLVKKIFNKINHKIEDTKNIENIEEMYIFVSQNELFLEDSYQIYSMNEKAIIYLYNSYIHSLPLFWKYDNKSELALQKIISII